MSKIEEKKNGEVHKKQTLCQSGTDPVRNRIDSACDEKKKKARSVRNRRCACHPPIP
jgi:hypothetical protein